MDPSSDEINKKHQKNKDASMQKFKVLEYNQILMAWIGIHSHHLTKPTNEFFKSPVTYYVLFITIVFSIISCAVYVFKNVSDFRSSLGACLVVIAGFQKGGLFLSTGLNMKKLKVLHLKLQEIIDKGTISQESN